MRDIKFRAWDKGHNKMSYKVNLYSMNNRGEMDKAQIDNQQVMKGIGLACEIMQFTGLKDKTGKDVYEGDILDFESREWGMPGFKSVVEWDEGNAEWSFGGGTASDVPVYRKVVGNIFEKDEGAKEDTGIREDKQ